MEVMYSRDLCGMREGGISISEEGFSKKWNRKYKGPEARTSLANSEKTRKTQVEQTRGRVREVGDKGG